MALWFSYKHERYEWMQTWQWTLLLSFSQGSWNSRHSAHNRFTVWWQEWHTFTLVQSSTIWFSWWRVSDAETLRWLTLWSWRSYGILIAVLGVRDGQQFDNTCITTRLFWSTRLDLCHNVWSNGFEWLTAVTRWQVWKSFGQITSSMRTIWLWEAEGSIWRWINNQFWLSRGYKNTRTKNSFSVRASAMRKIARTHELCA